MTFFCPKFLASISLMYTCIYNVNSTEKLNSSIPVVVNTWAFTDANQNAFAKLSDGGSALDAVEVGCSTCEKMQCDGTVGYGGSPDENGETTLDALIMDGKTMNVGAVGALRNVKNAVSVARRILDYTEHSFLVGSQATEFAVAMGFKEESLSTPHSKSMWKTWKTKNCQPNFWTRVSPNPKSTCGPYHPSHDSFNDKNYSKTYLNHDTIGMIAIDKYGNIATATSTNGASYKIPGRVGDSPIIGSGGYAENGIGGAAATGDGDILMRFLPSFKAVDGLKRGLSPEAAAVEALNTISKYYPKYFGAVVVVSQRGEVGAACHGIPRFPYSVIRNNQTKTEIFEVDCVNP